VITCKKTKTSLHCKKAENSVIEQQNSKNVLFSQIELKSVNWQQKGQESSFCSSKVKCL